MIKGRFSDLFQFDGRVLDLAKKVEGVIPSLPYGHLSLFNGYWL